MQSHNIGALFKELRVERGLRIADVAGELSVSTVSKFENGLSDISVEKLCLLLSNLGMDAPEFFEILNQNQNGDSNIVDSSLDALNQRLWKFSVSQDASGFKKLHHDFLAKFKATQNKFYKLKGIMVLSIFIDIQESHKLLSKADSKYVADYLMERDAWYKFEYSLYGDCVAFLQPQDFDRLYAKFLTIHFALHQRRNYLDLFFQTFYNIAASLYYRGQYASAVQTLDHLQQQKIPDNYFFIRLQLHMLKLLCQYKISSDQETLADLESILKVITKISPVYSRRWKADFKFKESLLQ